MSKVIKKAHGLLDNGYQVVPIDSKGKPVIKHFNDPDVFYSVVDAKDWKTRFDGAGLALVAGKEGVYALDFDIDCPDAANRLRKAVKKQWPHMPIRDCNNPRFAVIFRAKKSLLNVPNGKSNGYACPDFKNKKGKHIVSRIELIGNQPITMYGEHRKTGNSYKWSNKYTPLKMRVSELPKLTTKDVEKIFNLFQRLMESNSKWNMVEHGRIGTRIDNSATTFETSRSKKKYTDNRILELISRIDNDCSRDEWRDVGMAIHDAYDGSEEGLQVWDDWSSEGNPPSYDGYDHLKEQWGSFGKHARPLTMQTIESRAKKAKKHVKKEVKEKKKKKKREEKQVVQDTVVKQINHEIEHDILNWLENLVYIENGKHVVDIRKWPVANAMQTFDDYRAAHLSRREDMGEGDLNNVKTLVDVWAKHPDRVQCNDVVYYPCDDRVILGSVINSSENLFNMYEPARLPDTDRDDLVKYFLKHVKYVFNGEGDADWILNWMGQIVQHPHERMPVTPLSICLNHGVGRGWIVDLFREIVGVNNTTTVNDIHDMMQPGAKNEYMNNSVFCSIPETRAKGGMQYAVNSKLRHILDAKIMNIDLKYGFKGDKRVFTRLFMQSNHIDGLIFDSEDRRIEAFINRSLPKSKKYYRKLYVLLKSREFVSQVRNYLRSIEINYDWLQGPRDTEARREIIQAGLSKTSRAFYQFKTCIGNDWFTLPMLKSFISQHARYTDGDQMVSTSDKELGHLVKREAQASSTLTRDNGAIKVYNFMYMETKPSAKHIRKSASVTKQKIEIYFKQIDKRNIGETN